MFANKWLKSCVAGLLLFTFCSRLFAFSAYSNEELEELEKQFVEQINQSDAVERAPLARQYLNQLGQRLARQGHTTVPSFFIVKSNEINAFAGPGGHIGINTQLILATENESELASVMAHEIAHVRQHHLYRSFEHQKQMRVPMLASLLAAAALGAINPTLASGAMMASLTGFAQDNVNFTRSSEKEADRIGIDMLTRAGFDPRGMVRFFKKMQENSRYYYTDNIPAILRTHPLDEDRIAEAEDRIRKSTGMGAGDSPDYAFFREYIRVLTSGDTKRLLDFYQGRCNAKIPSAACQYGHAIALLQASRYQEALDRLRPLLAANPNNLYPLLSTAEAEEGLHQFAPALTRLQEATVNFPNNYAVMMAYAEGLAAAGKNLEASGAYLKASRIFPKDLPLCEALSRAQARAHFEGLAYFTRARCLLLQGRHRDAMRQLEQARLNAGKNHLLKAQVSALKEEIRFMADKRL